LVHYIYEYERFIGSFRPMTCRWRHFGKMEEVLIKWLFSIVRLHLNVLCCNFMYPYVQKSPVIYLK
jgi:hypothetical protein